MATVNQKPNVLMPDVICYIGLGSNLNEPEQQLSSALDALRNLPQTVLTACSSFYRSKALTLNADISAPDYLNAVAMIETGLNALTLLDKLQAIEFAQGRRRSGERWESRQLDLDILLYADESITNERLTVPHPEMCQRDFVLAPLAEIAPEIVIQGKENAASYLAACPKTILEKIPCARF